MVYGFLTERIKRHTAKIITFGSTKSLDIEEFKKDLGDCEWLLNNELASTEEKYSNWSEVLNKVMDKHMPIKSMRIREKDFPFMTTEWKAAIRMKRGGAKKYHKNKTKENLDLMKKWRNNDTRLRRTAIRDYWRYLSSESKCNPSKFYKTFMPLRSNKSRKIKQKSY